MIHFDFKRPNNENPEGVINIRVSGENDLHLNDSQFPLRLVHESITGEVVWSTDLYLGWYSEYLMNTHTRIKIIDSLGNKFFEWCWDPFIHGDFAHQFFEVWSLNNVGSNGIAIGTHNGLTGEWVSPVLSGKLKATLVEASEKQFGDLQRNYGGRSWVTCTHSLITSDGSDVVFYEGDNGFTNSVSKEIISQYVNEDVITSTVRKSKSINDLIVDSSKLGEIKWLHIDVEGIDGELIYAIKSDLLPNLLLFESLHMENNYYDKLCTYLIDKGYKVTKSGWNTICTK